MRCASGLLALIAVVAVACVTTQASEITSSPVRPEGAIEAVQDPATDDPAEVVVVSGRSALLAAQGEPHVLWFWGAH